MNSKISSLVLSLLFASAAVFLCPIMRPIFGIGSNFTNTAIHIYYWVGTGLFAFLVLVEFPQIPQQLKSIAKYGILLILMFTSIELLSALAHRILTGVWAHTIVTNQNQYLFEQDQELVGRLIKNARHQRGNLTYSHNSKGYRSDEFSTKTPEGKFRIIALGGSTTYGVGVNDDETWPHHLAQELGNDYEVINMGVPGYSTAENLIQTEMYLSELQPDLAIYYVGLNDLRNINIESLAADYSDFHRPSLYGAYGLCKNENLPSLASLKLLVMFGQKLGLAETCPNQQIDVKVKEHQGVDNRALSIYKSNLQRIDSICNNNGIEVLFVPQTLLEEVLTTGDYSWWIPYVPTEEMDDMMNAYNATMKAVADSNQVRFATKVLEQAWQPEDFVDLSHFTNDANKELAEILAKEIRKDSIRLKQ